MGTYRHSRHKRVSQQYSINGPFVFLMEIIILYGMNVTLYYGRWDRRLFTVVTSYAAIYSISSLMETLLLRITHMTRAEYLNNAPLYILFALSV